MSAKIAMSGIRTHVQLSIPTRDVFLNKGHGKSWKQEGFRLGLYDPHFCATLFCKISPV